MSTRIIVASGAAVLLLVSACASSKSTTSAGGGGGSTAPASASASASASAQAGAVTISMTGPTLTGADRKTLYTNTVDTMTKISCTGECATEWPPVTGTAKPGAGLEASKFGTATRPDGTKQVTFDGHPLYEFKGDSAAGDKKGEGLKDGGGTWHVATTSGAAAPAPSTDDSSGGGGSSGGGDSSGGGYSY